jgi:hypothetical protein
VSAEIVNLRRARKAKQKAEAAAQASAQRAAHGRTRAEREASAHEQKRLAVTLDGHRRDRGDGPVE